MAAPAWWVPYIKARARQMNLDPQAVLAVAQHEGLSGRPGDNNTSFGPFQLHVGGALPKGKTRAWAESRAGIDYALRSMSKVAGGLKGRAAVENIARRFERPANPGAEIADAMSHYGQFGGAGSLSAAPAGSPAGVSGAPGDSGGSFQQAMAQYLLQMASQGGSSNPSDLLSLAQMRSSMDQANTAGAAGATTPMQVGAAHGKGLSELFYDPLGGIKHDKQIGAIGGHDDHVHFATNTAQQMVAGIKHAQQMGMHVGENDYVGRVNPVHVKDSNHYRVLGTVNGKKVSGAADISGTPAQMAAFYRWAARNF